MKKALIVIAFFAPLSMAQGLDDAKAYRCHSYQQTMQNVITPYMESGYPLSWGLDYWEGTRPYENERNLKYLTRELYSDPDKIKKYVNSELFLEHCLQWVEI